MAQSFSLTDLEQQIFDILIQTVEYQKKSTVLRAAGGWVRDKLLGLPSDDIDIALDNQTGLEFAQAVNEYLSVCNIPIHTIGVIHANPTQSKHLETARLKIYDYELDFVNLRTETYSDHSRIPTTTEGHYGTPLEDALRRDFTINSLFYNLQTKEIEDLTGLGLLDLSAGLIRTPLDPMITFTDDPLRMLRAIRFSSRYHYCLHNSIHEVASKTEFHEALQLKVSKERQLKEISGCFHGNLCRPILAITTLHQFGLFSTVFSLPPKDTLVNELPVDQQSLPSPLPPLPLLHRSVEEVAERWESLSLQCSLWMNCLLHILQATSNSDNYHCYSAATIFSSIPPTPSPPTSSISLPLELLTQPIQNIAIPDATLNCTELFWTACVSGLAGFVVKEKKGKPIPLPQLVLRDSLKLDNDTLKAVTLTLQSALSFQSYLLTSPLSLEGLTDEEISSLRETLGLVIRDCKQYWRAGLVIACSLALSLHSSTPISLDYPVELTPYHLEIIQQYNRIGVTILTFHLDEIWLSRPHYDGDALVNELQMKRGPQLGKIVEKQFRWQLRYPHRAREECLEYLRQELVSLS